MLTAFVGTFARPNHLTTQRHQPVARRGSLSCMQPLSAATRSRHTATRSALPRLTRLFMKSVCVIAFTRGSQRSVTTPVADLTGALSRSAEAGGGVNGYSGVLGHHRFSTPGSLPRGRPVGAGCGTLGAPTAAPRRTAMTPAQRHAPKIELHVHLEGTVRPGAARRAWPAATASPPPPPPARVASPTCTTSSPPGTR